MPIEDWTPTVDEVAALVWARTKVAGGKQIGTFNENTRPDQETAEAIILQATQVTTGYMSASPCSTNLKDATRSLAAAYAAMLIEVSFYPEQTEAQGSSFQARLKLWEKSVSATAAIVKENCGASEEEESEGGGDGAALVAGGFDEGELLYGRDWPPRGDW